MHCGSAAFPYRFRIDAKDEPEIGFSRLYNGDLNDGGRDTADTSATQRIFNFRNGHNAVEKRYSEFLGGRKRFWADNRNRFINFDDTDTPVKRFSEFLGGRKRSEDADEQFATDNNYNKRYSEFLGGK
jgi:hypothetical protein